MADGNSRPDERPEVAADPLVGKVLDGRFAVVEAIGSGGMGKVYKAIQRPLDRLVALKVLNPNYASSKDPGFQRRFFLEASQTAKLSHPNTITVHDYGKTEDGIFYIAMEFVEGVTLAEVITREGALTIPRALHVTGQVARSLREAHKLGLIHRDLKPANVMLLHEETDHDRVKVLDFGLVKTFTADRPHEPSVDETALTQAGVVMGSPLYMAPEQARGQADPRSDIYSMGVVLFQMLTGRPPFQSKDSIDVIVKHLNEIPPRLEAVRADLEFPPEIEALVARMLEKRPEDRFQSMDEVLEAVRATGLNTGLSGVFSSPRSGVHSTPKVATVPPPLPTAVTQAEVASDTAFDVSVSQPAKKPLKSSSAIALFVGALVLGVVVVIAGTYSTDDDKVPPKDEPLRDVARVEPPPEKPVVKAPPPAVKFLVESEPSGAQVFRGDKLLGTTPLRFEKAPDEDGVARDELTFSLDGYLPVRTAASGLGAEVRVKEKLKKKPAGASGKKKPVREDGYKDDPYSD